MPILDTNFLIALERGEATARRLLEENQGQPLLVPSLVAAEYLTDFSDPAHAQAALERAFTIVQTDEAWMRHAIRLRQENRGSGRIRRNDLWIAAWARSHDTVVLTRDGEDFKRLRVKTRSW